MARGGACAAAARADPRRATELALPIRECLDASAPAPARALAMEAIASMCEADALDFYLAFKVVAKRAPAAPDDPLVASRWAALLAHGAADADARPDAAAAVVAAAWDVARAGVTPLVERARETLGGDARGGVSLARARYDASILVESPASDADADGASTDGPVPAADLATAYLREPSFGVGSAAEAAAEATYNVARRERDAMARAAFAPTSRPAMWRRRRERRRRGSRRRRHRRRRSAPTSRPQGDSASVANHAAPRRRDGCARRDDTRDWARGGGRAPFTLPAARGGGRRRRDERPATRLGTPRASSSTRRRAPSCVSRVRFRSVHGVAAPRMVVAREPLVAIVVAIRAAVGGRGTRRARGRRGSGGAWRGSRRGARERRGRSPRRAEGRTHPGRRAVRRVSARLARRTTRLSRRGGVRRRRRIIRRVRIHRLLLRVHRRVRDGRHRIDVRAGRFRRRGARSVFGARRRRGACHAGDRERRAAAMETLASRAFSRDAIGDAAAGAAAEGLGLLARSLGIAVAADGPGAGAWRAEMLRDAASRFDRLRADAAAAERASAASFAVGAATGATFAAMGSTRRVRRAKVDTREATPSPRSSPSLSVTSSEAPPSSSPPRRPNTPQTRVKNKHSWRRRRRRRRFPPHWRRRWRRISPSTTTRDAPFASPRKSPPPAGNTPRWRRNPESRPGSRTRTFPSPHPTPRARSRPPPRRCARRVARPSGRFSTRPSPRAFPSRAYSRSRRRRRARRR